MRSGIMWIGLVGVIAAMSLSGAVMLVRASRSDAASFAVEPDYYRKAVHWDEVAAQRRANERLGWRAVIESGPGGVIVVTVTDREGAAIDGARLSAEVFAQARAADRRAVEFTAQGEGRYDASFSMNRAGSWRVRLRAERGGEVFTHEADITFTPTSSCSEGEAR